MTPGDVVAVNDLYIFNGTPVGTKMQGRAWVIDPIVILIHRNKFRETRNDEDGIAWFVTDGRTYGWTWDFHLKKACHRAELLWGT